MPYITTTEASLEHINSVNYLFHYHFCYDTDGNLYNTNNEKNILKVAYLLIQVRTYFYIYNGANKIQKKCVEVF